MLRIELLILGVKNKEEECNKFIFLQHIESLVSITC